LLWVGKQWTFADGQLSVSGSKAAQLSLDIRLHKPPSGQLLASISIKGTSVLAICKSIQS
jgi:hypothetical protein